MDEGVKILANSCSMKFDNTGMRVKKLWKRRRKKKKEEAKMKQEKMAVSRRIKRKDKLMQAFEEKINKKK